MTSSYDESSPQLEDIRSWLIQHIADHLNVSSAEIDVNEPFESFGLSSKEMVMISGDLEEWLDKRLEPTLVWQYPTIELISRYLVGEEAEEEEIIEISSSEKTKEPIAVIGIGCRFPGGDGPKAYWDVLINGVDAISKKPLERWDNNEFYDPETSFPGSEGIQWGGFLKDVDLFDNEFFKISPREAVGIDPQQRLLLEVTWEALENAGLVPGKLAGISTGIFVGISTSDYSMLQFSDPSLIDAYAGTGNAHSVAANRLSYFFDFQGPSIAIDTACSSSLVSIHLAAQSLKNGECDIALAGGVSLILSPGLTLAFSKAQMLAADGRCKTFDASADGYVRGEGCGMVVLKRLSDAAADHDPILGLIRGSAINHDGKSNGLTAPNGLSQQAVIRKSLSNANLEPDQISYLEAHGTGTRLGDPIEFNALKAVFKGSNNSNKHVALGSVKTNIGHLEAAAGIASFIKVLLALKNEVIPPHLHLKEINPQINLEDTPFTIPTSTQEWPVNNQKTRYAGISSFGFGGTNAHVILEGSEGLKIYPEDHKQKGKTIERPLDVLTLSAMNEPALQELSGRYATFLESKRSQETTIPDICYTANTGRQLFDYRIAFISEDVPDLTDQLRSFYDSKSTKGYIYNNIKGKKIPKTAFLFTGQGSQYVGMARELYETEPTFRTTLEICNAIAKSQLEPSLLSVIFSEDENQKLIHETAYTQPALYALEIALANLLRDWGVQPNLVLGHSIGEFAAACFAGAFSLEDGFKLVLERGRLMQDLPRNGSMAVVFTELEEVVEKIRDFSDKLSIATVNGPTNIVVSGSTHEVQRIVQEFENLGIESRSLEVSHAFHSPLMEPILDAFRDTAEKIQFQPLVYPLASNLTGQIIQKGEILSGDYWVQHIRKPVLFASGMDALAESGVEIFIEIGPSPVLLGMAKRLIHSPEHEWLPTLRKGKSDWRILLNTLATLHTRGIPVDWEAFDRNYERRRISLPTYPFTRKRFWFGTGPREQHSVKKPSIKRQDSSIDWLYQLAWEQEDRPLQQRSQPVESVPNLIFADEGGVGVLLAKKINDQGQQCILIHAGKDFKAKDDTYSINPTRKEDFTKLFNEVITGNEYRIIHLWSLNSSFLAFGTQAALQQDLDLGCVASLNIIQTIEDLRKSKKVDFSIWFITRGSQQVGIKPEKVNVSQAPLWGLARTIALEYPDIWGGLIDLDPNEVDEQINQIWNTIHCLSKEDQIAFRSRKRFVARLKPIRESEMATRTYACDPEFAYLITGGTGALGLSVAKRLIERDARHLILASRTEFPPQSDEGSSETDEDLTRKLSAIKALEELGANIYLLSVDVSNEDQMTTLFRDRLREYPPIRGVIHMAGVVLPQTIRQMSPEELIQVLRPKVFGTWLLHEMVADIELDFFILFSSAASVINSPLLGSYAAANTFLDAMAHYRSALNKTALSINWGFWSGGGMAHQYQESMGRTIAPKGMVPIPTEKGLDILEGLLGSRKHQVGVLPTDWTVWSQHQPRIKNLPIFSIILNPSMQETSFVRSEISSIEESTTIAKKVDTHKLFLLPPEEWGDYLVNYIKKSVANALYMKPDEIDSDQNLMELGIDSLMVMELTGNLERDFQITVYPREVFERPSIRSFAEYLEGEIIRLHPEKMVDKKDLIKEIPITNFSLDSGYLGIPAGNRDYHQPEKKNPKVAFILSSPRTGSTLLRVMLAGHPDLFCPPELHLLPFENMKARSTLLGESYLGEGLIRAIMEINDLEVESSKALIDDWIEKEVQIEEVYEYLQRKVEPRLLVDKSPSYAINIDALERAEDLFDTPRYLFLSRHPYAMMESFVRNRIDKLIGIEAVDPFDIAEHIWAVMNANILDFFNELEPSRYLIIKYEDLVKESEPEMRKVSQFLGVEFHQSMLNPYVGNRMTDGLFDESRSIGDPNFLKHEKIDPKLGEVWNEIQLPRRLGGFAKRVAKELQYELPAEDRKSVLRKVSGQPRTQKNPRSEITRLSRDKHRIKSPDQGSTELNDSLEDKLLRKDG